MKRAESRYGSPRYRACRNYPPAHSCWQLDTGAIFAKLGEPLCITFSERQLCRLKFGI